MAPIKNLRNISKKDSEKYCNCLVFPQRKILQENHEEMQKGKKKYNITSFCGAASDCNH